MINQVECCPVLAYNEAEMFLSIRNMDAIGDFDKSSFSGTLIFNSS